MTTEEKKEKYFFIDKNSMAIDSLKEYLGFGEVDQGNIESLLNRAVESIDTHQHMEANLLAAAKAID